VRVKPEQHIALPRFHGMQIALFGIKNCLNWVSIGASGATGPQPTAFACRYQLFVLWRLTKRL